MEKGKSVTAEGNDGTGKSTQMELLSERLWDDYRIKSMIIHEPDGPGICAPIRQIIKNGSLERDAITNLLLFTASRHESNKIGEVAMENGTWLLKARDSDSSKAYQGGGEGLDADFIDAVTAMFTTQRYMKPDLKVILTLPDIIRSKRIAQRGELEDPDTFEQRDNDFQQRVNRAYIEIAEHEGHPTIDASQSREAVHEQIMELIWARGLLVRR